MIANVEVKGKDKKFVVVDAFSKPNKFIVDTRGKYYSDKKEQANVFNLEDAYFVLTSVGSRYKIKKCGGVI